MCAFKRLIESLVLPSPNTTAKNIMRGIKSENRGEIQEELANTYDFERCIKLTAQHKLAMGFGLFVPA